MAIAVAKTRPTNCGCHNLDLDLELDLGLGLNVGKPAIEKSRMDRRTIPFTLRGRSCRRKKKAFLLLGLSPILFRIHSPGSCLSPCLPTLRENLGYE